VIGYEEEKAAWGWVNPHAAQEENGSTPRERDFPMFLTLSQWRENPGTWVS
jgi:hypothetical protein